MGFQSDYGNLWTRNAIIGCEEQYFCVKKEWTSYELWVMIICLVMGFQSDYGKLGTRNAIIGLEETII